MQLSDARKYLKKVGVKGGSTSTLIADRALARGVPIFADSQRRLTLQRGNRQVWFNGSRSNINNVLAQRSTRYKDITSRLLRNYGVNAPENVVFGPDQLLPAWSWAEHQTPVVVKPPNGDKGALVHMGISEFTDFEKAFTAVASAAGEVLVERFLKGIEHRVVLIYGKVAAAQRRVPAHVIGDGALTIAQLVKKKNHLRRTSKNPIYIKAQIPIDDVVVRELEAQALSLNAVPQKGQQIWLRPNSNIHSGGEAHDATDELSAAEIAMAEQVAKAIPGLRIAGLDMLLPREGNGTKPYVLEVNSSPLITGHHYPWSGPSRDVAAILIDAMFPADRATGS